MPKSEEVMAAVDGWFNERIKRGPIAHHTPAYNQAYQAIPDLKARLAKVLEPKEEAPAEAPAPAAPEPKAPVAKKAPAKKPAKAKTPPAAPAAPEPKE